MNRQQLATKLSAKTSEVLKRDGYISFPQLFIALGALTSEDYNAWRMRKIPFLERAIRMNLSQISFVMKTVRKTSLNGKLKPSWTAYMSWGKGNKVRLRFSKTGTPAIEDLWATHFLAPKPDKNKESATDAGLDFAS
jgi:hypothetical protein